MSPRLKVGDFGCGEAKLMEEIGHDRVISFDHVAINYRVIACDVKSASEYVKDGNLDVVVFCLSSPFSYFAVLNVHFLEV